MQISWFPRQLVNYLFQQLCLKAGRPLTLPLPPRAVTQEAMSVLSPSNTVSMINVPGTFKDHCRLSSIECRQRFKEAQRDMRQDVATQKEQFEQHIAEPSKSKSKKEKREKSYLLCHGV